MITYIKGDVTEPVGDGPKIIAHCCNDIGVMGAGVALALRRKWPSVWTSYRKLFENDQMPALGFCQEVLVEEGLTVANIIGQRGVGYDSEGDPPVRYMALLAGLKSVGITARGKGLSIHLPRLGAGLAGGDWDIISKMIDQVCGDVTVYDFE